MEVLRVRIRSQEAEIKQLGEQKVELQGKYVTLKAEVHPFPIEYPSTTAPTHD